MSQQNIEKVKEMISSICGYPQEKLDDNVKLIFYGLDSVRAVELISLLEESYHIQVPEADLAKLQTIRQIDLYLNKVAH